MTNSGKYQSYTLHFKAYKQYPKQDLAEVRRFLPESALSNLCGVQLVERGRYCCFFLSSPDPLVIDSFSSRDSYCFFDHLIVS